MASVMYQINKLLLFPLLLVLEPVIGVPQAYNRACYAALVGICLGVWIVPGIHGVFPRAESGTGAEK